MKKLISALLVLALLMTTGCSLSGKNGSDAKKMDAFLKDYAKFAALSDDAEADPEEDCCFGRVIVFGEPELKGFKPLGTITDLNGFCYVQFATPEEAQAFLKAQTEAGIEAAADNPVRIIPEEYESYSSPDDYVEPSGGFRLEDAGFTLSGQAQEGGGFFRSWGTSFTGASVYASLIMNQKKNSTQIVAVIDNGADLSHSFLKPHLISGYDFIDNDADPSATRFHGTHVAGTIIDMACGLDIRIMPIRSIGFLKKNNKGELEELGSSSSVSLGIDYAVAHGAKVINMSIGSDEVEPLIEKAIQRAVASGVTVVAAAGNDLKPTTKYSPARMTDAGVIVVSAFDYYQKFAEFSNYGKSVDLSAPGVNIISAYPGGTVASANGTSMATPHVSAACAMVRMMHPEFSPAQIESFLKKYAKDLGDPGRDDLFGAGALNLRECDRDTLVELWVDTLPDKTEYTVGDDLDQKGLVIMARYIDGTVEMLCTYDDFMSGSGTADGRYKIGPLHFDKAGTIPVTIEYKGLKCSFDVKVNETPPFTPPELDNPYPDPTRPFGIIFSPTPEAPEMDACDISEPSLSKYGVSYDAATNTVTLNNVKDGWLRLNAAGNSLTLNILGNCRLHFIWADGWGHSSSIRFTGTGTLTVEPLPLTDRVLILSEFSQGCIIVEKGVCLKFMLPVEIHTSLIQNALFVDDMSRVHAKITSVPEEPVDQPNQWIVDDQIYRMETSPVPTVYKTIIEADEYDYILIDP